MDVVVVGNPSDSALRTAAEDEQQQRLGGKPVGGGGGGVGGGNGDGGRRATAASNTNNNNNNDGDDDDNGTGNGGTKNASKNDAVVSLTRRVLFVAVKVTAVVTAFTLTCAFVWYTMGLPFLLQVVVVAFIAFVASGGYKFIYLVYRTAPRDLKWVIVVSYLSVRFCYLFHCVNPQNSPPRYFLDPRNLDFFKKNSIRYVTRRKSAWSFAPPLVLLKNQSTTSTIVS